MQLRILNEEGNPKGRGGCCIWYMVQAEGGGGRLEMVSKDSRLLS